LLSRINLYGKRLFFSLASTTFIYNSRIHRPRKIHFFNKLIYSEYIYIYILKKRRNVKKETSLKKERKKPLLKRNVKRETSLKNKYLTLNSGKVDST
jgi:hypothetical protein